MAGWDPNTPKPELGKFHKGAKNFGPLFGPRAHEAKKSRLGVDEEGIPYVPPPGYPNYTTEALSKFAAAVRPGLKMVCSECGEKPTLLRNSDLGLFCPDCYKARLDKMDISFEPLGDNEMSPSFAQIRKERLGIAVSAQEIQEDLSKNPVQLDPKE